MRPVESDMYLFFFCLPFNFAQTDNNCFSKVAADVLDSFGIVLTHTWMPRISELMILFL